MNAVDDQNQDPGTIEIIDFVVGFLDFLNQKHYLGRWGTEADINNKRPESIDAIQKTLGTIHELRKRVIGYASHYNPASPLPSSLQNIDPEKRAIYEKVANSKIDSFAFTDTVVFFAPANLSDGVAHMRSVFGVVFSVALTHFCMLSDGVATRGSVEVGLGCRDLFADLYGPCISSAYQLESECAKYPRLVVGDGLLQFLNKTEDESGDEVISPMNQSIASFTKQFLSTDADGMAIVDFAGEAVAGMTDKILQSGAMSGPISEYLRGLFPRSRQFVSNSLGEFKDINPVLFDRYSQLDSYLDRNKQFWIQ